MPRITIHVAATVGSRIGRATAEGHSIFARSHHADGWPIGCGKIADTLDQNGHRLPALVLMTEPALPGPLHAWPIGLIRINDQDQGAGIIACVAEAPPFRDLLDLAHPSGWHADADDWLAALRRLQPTLPRHARAHGGRDDAEALIAASRQPPTPADSAPTHLGTATPQP